MRYFKPFLIAILLILSFGIVLFPSQGFTTDVVFLPEQRIFFDSDQPSMVPLSTVAEGAEPFVPSLPEEFVPGEMLIKFKEHIKPDHPELTNLKNELGAELQETHDTINVHFFKLKKVKDKAETLKAIEKFQKHHMVEYAEPNGIGQGGFVPNDTCY